MKIWINRAGQNLGTFTLEEVQRGLNQGQFVATDLAWQEGMETWRPLSEFPGVQIPPAPEPVAPVTAAELVPATASTEAAPAWERRPQVKLIPAFFLTVRDVVLEPHRTFPRMPIDGKLWNPLTFYFGMFILHSAVSALLLLFYIPVMMSSVADSRLGNNASLLYVILIPVAWVLSLLIMVASTFIGAGVIHLLLMLLGGANRGFDATYKIYVYSFTAPLLLSYFPCIGSFAWFASFAISAVIGVEKVHGVERWKSVTAVLAPLLVCVVVCGGLLTGYVFWAMDFVQHQRYNY